MAGGSPHLDAEAGSGDGVVARRGEVVLRHARQDDFTAIDELTVIGYRAIQESFVAMCGADLARALQGPQPWEQRKCAQNHRLFARAPDHVWVLEDSDGVFGYVTFDIDRDVGYGRIDNNAVHPSRSGAGWATFMYRHVLDRFRALGLRWAHVDTGLDDAHIAARRAYEAVGFDRKVPLIDYWQDLTQRNRGSEP